MRISPCRRFAWLPVLVAAGCASLPAPSPDPAHILYLHGKIVQDQGVEAVSPEYGRYAFHDIVAALGAQGARVHAPVRTRGATVDASAAEVVQRVHGLLREGAVAERITVVGASLGAVIAMRASTLLADPRLSFVVLGACNDWTFDTLRPQLHGRVLSIYEHGDSWGGSCRRFAEQAGVRTFEEIGLHTGLSHGFLYRPLPVWVEPTLAWAHAADD